MSKTLKN